MEKASENDKEQKKKNYIDDIKIEDDSLINELNYSFSSNSLKEKFSDSAVLIRASKSKIINRILAQNQFDLKDTTWKRPPPTSLFLEHVYGVQTSDRRDSVRYLHLSSQYDTSEKEKKEIMKDFQRLKDKLGPLAKVILKNSEKAFEPIKYEQKHITCHKHFIYYTSRLGVVFNPIKNKQEFYEGHRLKISAMTLHPLKSLIATGEVNVTPDIHVWNPQTLETLVVLTTLHKGGILHLAFSGDGVKLIS
jgi:WD40 repeat protein